MEDNKIIFTDEDGSTEEFYVVEETKINDIRYLLVCESMDDETEAFILAETSVIFDMTLFYHVFLQASIKFINQIIRCKP